MTTPYKITAVRTGALPAARRLGEGGISLRDFWLSRAYFPVLLSLSALCLLFDLNILGMVCLAAFVAAAGFMCVDLTAGLLPLLLFLLLGAKYYSNLSSLLSIWWILPPVVAGLIYNLIHRGVKIIRPAAFRGLAAVSLAAALGGAGVISAGQYFSPVALYYTVGLGAGLLLAATLFASEFNMPREYNLADRLSTILLCAGIFTCFVVLDIYLERFSEFMLRRDVLYIPYRNYLTTVLLMALPMPFRRLRENRAHLAAIAFIYLCLLLTGSRSGLLFGTVMLFLCAYLTALGGKKPAGRERALIIPFLLAAAALVLILCQTVLSSRLVDGTLFPMSDSRIDFMKLALADFLSNPLTGIGLGNMKNSAVFLGVGGSIVWYHNYFAQIIGSMGLVGVAAYALLLRDRLRSARALVRSGEGMIAAAWLGMLLVSMTNPGEFCPLPNAFIMVVLFEAAQSVLTEKR